MGKSVKSETEDSAKHGNIGPCVTANRSRMARSTEYTVTFAASGFCGPWRDFRAPDCNPWLFARRGDQCSACTLAACRSCVSVEHVASEVTICGHGVAVSRRVGRQPGRPG